MRAQNPGRRAVLVLSFWACSLVTAVTASAQGVGAIGGTVIDSSEGTNQLHGEALFCCV